MYRMFTNIYIKYIAYAKNAMIRNVLPTSLNTREELRLLWCDSVGRDEPLP